MSTHTRLDEMAVKVKEIRQLTGVRYLLKYALYIFSMIMFQCKDSGGKRCETWKEDISYSE